MASVESYKKPSIGGFFRSAVRLRRNREANKRALAEISAFKREGNSNTFYSPYKHAEIAVYLAPGTQIHDCEATPQDIENRLKEQREGTDCKDHTLGNLAHLPRSFIENARMPQAGFGN